MPYVLIEATRASVMGSADPTNVTYPLGSVTVDPARREITGHNPERQDFIIGPSPAPNFAGYFCARFDTAFASFGTVQNGSNAEDVTDGRGMLLSAFARFVRGTREVNVRVGVSFISVEQARKNLGTEIPDGTTLEQTAEKTRAAWAEKLDRIKVEGATREENEVFYTAVFHALQVSRAGSAVESGTHRLLEYPYEQSEDGKYYSGYDDKIHEGESYTGYSIWVRYTLGSAIVCMILTGKLGHNKGHIPRCMGVADPPRSRTHSTDGAEYAAGLP